MPLYEYQCDVCANRFERIQKFADPPVDACPNCGGPVRKLLSSPAIQFKGSGWYITDYAKKPTTKSDDGKGAKTESSTDSAAKGTSSSTSQTGTTGSKESSAGSKTTSSDS